MSLLLLDLLLELLELSRCVAGVVFCGKMWSISSGGPTAAAAACVVEVWYPSSPVLCGD